MEPFLGEIILFAGNFAPRGWAFCEGQLLPISGNEALFSLLGTVYGGDGRTTFALPDLRGRAPLHPGRGPGLSDRRLGQKLGSETNTLTTNELPPHNHPFSGTINASSADGSTTVPTGSYPAKGEQVVSRTETKEFPVYSNSKDSTMAADAVSGTTGNTGANQPVNNMQPSLGINFIIAMQGIFPSRG